MLFPMRGTVVESSPSRGSRMKPRVCVIYQPIVFFEAPGRRMLAPKTQPGHETSPRAKPAAWGGVGPFFFPASATNKPTTSTNTHKNAVAPNRPTNRHQKSRGGPQPHPRNGSADSRRGAESIKCRVTQKSRIPRTHRRRAKDLVKAGAWRAAGEGDRGRAARPASWPRPGDAGLPRPDTTTKKDRGRAARQSQWP